MPVPGAMLVQRNAGQGFCHLRNAVTMGAYPSGDAPCRNPITGIVGCCARAASGHAAPAPPSVAKNFRRPMKLAM